jgi:hypothetical protein
MAGDDGSIGSGSGGGGGGIRDREDEVHVQIAGQFSARYLSLSTDGCEQCRLIIEDAMRGTRMSIVDWILSFSAVCG